MNFMNQCSIVHVSFLKISLLGYNFMSNIFVNRCIVGAMDVSNNILHS